jgi:hypothetical protein
MVTRAVQGPGIPLTQTPHKVLSLCLNHTMGGLSMSLVPVEMKSALSPYPRSEQGQPKGRAFAREVRWRIECLRHGALSLCRAGEQPWLSCHLEFLLRSHFCGGGGKGGDSGCMQSGLGHRQAAEGLAWSAAGHQVVIVFSGSLNSVREFVSYKSIAEMWWRGRNRAFIYETTLPLSDHPVRTALQRNPHT